MTRQQVIFIVGLNAVISLVISLLVVWFLGPRAAPPPSPQLMTSTAPTAKTFAQTHASSSGQAASPMTPTPLIHIVKSGETLSWIAQIYDVAPERIAEANNLTDPDVLAVGQELIIPPSEAEPVAQAEAQAASPTPTEAKPSPTATPTPVPSQGEVDLKITNIVARGRREAEILVLTNKGQDIRLQGWTLSNDRGQVFTFPNLVLYSGNSIRIYTTKGRNTASDLYWGLDTAAWGPEVEMAILKDPQGEVRATKELQ